MTDLKPIFAISRIASGLVAPPQAIVVSTCAKVEMPGISFFVTCCGGDGCHHEDADDEDGYFHAPDRDAPPLSPRGPCRSAISASGVQENIDTD